MSYAHNEHYKWIEQNYNIKCSELGKEVSNIIGFVGGGIYNSPVNHKKTDYTNPYFIEIIWRGSFSNYDFAKLTYLLIECFDRMIRIDIRPHSFSYLKLLFHKRKTRDFNAGMSKRLPTIEHMIKRQRELFNRPEEQEK